MRALPVLVALAGLLPWLSGTESRPRDIAFDKQTIDLGASETCAIADINRDGKPDIVSGEYWYEAPGWTPHRFRELNYSNFYVDDFSDLPLDADGDGHIDVVSCSWFSRTLSWWKNPGRKGGAWTEQAIEKGFPIEFAFLVDLDNDGRAREVLPQFGNAKAPLAWYEFSEGAWAKHVAAPQSYGHGIGAGDLNGDGRTDILTPRGWLESPPDPRSGPWSWHPDFSLGDTGFIHVIDLDGDGRRDILTSLAHDYGIFWMERGDGGEWARRVIDDSWSQAHALVLADLNGDGRLDLLTGKRYMAHNGRDPGEREPLGVYWYEHRKAADGTLNWTRHVVDYSTRTGAGMQVAVADIDADGALDFAVGGKSGLFLFRSLRGRRR